MQTYRRTPRGASNLRFALGAIVALTSLTACKKSHSANGEVTRNWTPPKQEVYLGVPAAVAQAAVQTRLTAAPPAPITDDQWKHVKKLYQSFNQSLLWLDDKGVHQPRVAALLNALASADSDGLKLDAYPLAELNRSLSAIGDKPTAAQLADADVLLSAAFTAYGETMLTGQVAPGSLGQAWHINPLEERVDSALSLTLREDEFSNGLVRMRPQDPGYDSLRTQFASYREFVKTHSWSTPVPAGKILRRGDSDSPARLEALRARLRAEGYLDAPADSSVANAAIPDSAKPKAAPKPAARTDRSGPAVYDRALAAAVADFQAHHSIGVDSMLGKETVDAMNVPADYRLAQIAANLERFRWMPRSLGSRYILVNVPAFRLVAYDSGEKALEMKVIVGQEYEDKATPVFSDSMQFVVFRPFWNVTPDIAAKEIFPKAAADPSYLATNNMEVYTDHGRKAVRQLPGPKNSLGFVKFIFPNDYNIYLHDTPNHELFSKDVRAFSHGCIRLEKPAELAQWVLGWAPDKVQDAMNGTDNHQVNLPKKLPVYIVYFTTFVQGNHLYFGNDLYDRDSKLVKQLESETLSSPETVQAQAALRALAKS